MLWYLDRIKTKTVEHLEKLKFLHKYQTQKTKKVLKILLYSKCVLNNM